MRIALPCGLSDCSLHTYRCQYMIPISDAGDYSSLNDMRKDRKIDAIDNAEKIIQKIIVREEEKLFRILIRNENR